MDEVTTGVDELMELVKKEKRISIADAARKLKQSEFVIQNWVDFLVEEKLLGIEYKFTTPYIYFNDPQGQGIKRKAPTITEERKLFLVRAREKGVPQEKVSELWTNHLLEAIEHSRTFFEQECAKRKLDPEPLYRRYKEKLLEEYELRTSA